MITFNTLGDMLLRRYIVDFIAQMQNLSAPIYTQLQEDTNFTPSGDGAYFGIRIAGNEAGGGWRATDDNVLPTASNENVKQARVRPKKYYHTVTFSGLAEAVSARGGEDAFAAGITDAISQAVKRAGARFETDFLRGDGTGRLTNTSASPSASTTIAVDDARPFRSGQVIVGLSNSTGLRIFGPVTVVSRSISGATITVSSAVTGSGSANDGIYISGEQSEASAPTEVTALGLPAIVSATGTIYNLSRTTYPILQSKVIAAGSVALDEALLRRLRRQLLVETDVGSLEGFAMISNWEQYDRYTEISLPFRRFNDMRLELGAQQELTTFEGRPWLISHQALPDQVFQLNLGAVVRGVVRPLSIDERVNMAWVPGQDAFTVLLKYYGENVARMPNQTAKLTGLTTPTY
ncbi:hypothetical protein LCGC14_0208900 [marine sediment metagenome]|uniref:Uncharacterized protein n=1 Tax=marine sediment metagenome TaxID=412755 RepID=A0A0F9UL96_9ZZZZ